MREMFLKKLSGAAIVALAFAVMPMPDGMARAADLVQKNAFAYDISVSAGENAYERVINYKLNGTASAVNIKLYNGTTAVATYAGTTKHENSVVLDLRELGNTAYATLTSKIEVTTKTPVTAARVIADKTSGQHGSTSNGRWHFLNPWSITVNNVTGSATFGRIVVAEAKYDEAIGIGSTAGTSSSTIYHSQVASSGNSGRGAMLYAFDPQFQPIESSTGKYGFCGDLSLTKAKLNVTYGSYSTTGTNGITFSSSEIVSTFSFVRYSSGGSLFFSSANKNYRPVYKFDDPNNLKGSTKSVFATSGGSHNVGLVNAFDLSGSGSGLKILVLHNSNGTPVPSNHGFNTSYFTMGANTNITSKPDRTRSTTANNTLNERLQRVAFDPTGESFWLSRNFGSGATNYRHQINDPGNSTDIKASPESTSAEFNLTGAIAYNKDGTLLARQEGKGKVVVYKCKSPYGESKLTKWCEILVGKSASDDALLSGQWERIHDIAFDYANNIYLASASQHFVASFQIPNPDGNTVTTPTRSAFNITGYDPTSTALTLTSQYKKYDKQTRLSWTATDLPDAVSYNIYRAGVLIDNVPASQTTFTYDETEEGSVNYKVKAVNRHGSEVKASANANTTIVIPTLELGVNYETAGVVNLEWQGTNIEETTNFMVYRDGDEYIVKDSNIENHTITVPDSREAHYYYIVARDNNGELIKSNTVLLGFINPDFQITPDFGETQFSDNGIVRLKASVTWNRPKSCEFNDIDQDEHYVLSHYELLMQDPEGNSVDITGADVSYTYGGQTYTATVTDHNDDDIMEVDDPITHTLLADGPASVRRRAASAVPGVDEEVTFEATYPGDDIAFGEYTMTITPVYLNASNEEVNSIGAVASNIGAMDESVFTPVNELAIQCFQGRGMNNVYRVDIDFKKPTTEMPITYYGIRYRTAPEASWTKLRNFFVIKGSEVYYCPASGAQHMPSRVASFEEGQSVDFETAVQQGVILGTYDFDTERGYAVNPPEPEAKSCVAFFYTDTDPRGIEFEVTAYYGAANSTLLAAEETDASTTAYPSANMPTTGIDAVMADSGNAKARVFPVPATDRITVETAEDIENVKIYGASGRLMLNADFKGNSNVERLDIGHLPAGIYVLSVNNRMTVRLAKK